MNIVRAIIHLPGLLLICLLGLLADICAWDWLGAKCGEWLYEYAKRLNS